nr:E4 [human papillomavirus 73]
MADSAPVKYPFLKLLTHCTPQPPTPPLPAPTLKPVCHHGNGKDSVTRTRGPWIVCITYIPPQSPVPSVLHIMLRQ